MQYAGEEEFFFSHLIFAHCVFLGDGAVVGLTSRQGQQQHCQGHHSPLDRDRGVFRIIGGV